MSALRGETRGCDTRWILVLSLLVLVSERVRASDCLDRLGENAGWLCSAELSSGATVDYCLGLTHAFGAEASSRFFKLNVTGPYPRTCTCGVKGKAPGARYGEDSTYLCLDRVTNTVESGKISKKKITGQTFNARDNVRSTFTCQPDPTCVLPPVIDEDLPALHGSTELSSSTSPFRVKLTTSGGPVDLSYLTGCNGFASEEPDFVVNYTAGGILLVFDFDPPNIGTFPPSDTTMVVVLPSGEARCDLDSGVENRPRVHVDSPQGGPYRVYVASVEAGAAIGGTLIVFP